jgi:hypothetical protein
MFFGSSGCTIPESGSRSDKSGAWHLCRGHPRHLDGGMGRAEGIEERDSTFSQRTARAVIPAGDIDHSKVTLPI